MIITLTIAQCDYCSVYQIIENGKPIDWKRYKSKKAVCPKCAQMNGKIKKKIDQLPDFVLSKIRMPQFPVKPVRPRKHDRTAA